MLLPEENSVNYVRHKPRMDSIRIVQLSVTVSFFVSVIFYCMIYKGYYMAAWGYEFHLLVLKLSLTLSLRSLVRDIFSTRR